MTTTIFKGKTAFAPIANEKSKILILGTMPGEQSLKLQQYYGHGGNQFWKIMFNLLNVPFSSDYSKRKDLLLSNGIALWDVLSHCERKGSSDSKIINEIPNDFNSFYQSHSNIKYVFLTSGKAELFYNKYIQKRDGKEYFLLPSPSRANTWKTFEEKVDEWRIIKEVLYL